VIIPTVRRRRARSLDLAPRVREVSRERNPRNPGLTQEQNRTVQAAEAAMNAEQNDLVNRRQQLVNSTHRE
jgi:hypothetical protein